MYLTKDANPADYEIYESPGMKGVRRMQFLNPENSSKNFALRGYIIEPNGHTSYDIHPHEHGVYIMSGEVLVRVGEEELLLHEGDIIHIQGNEIHQFFNHGSELVKFLCVRDFTTS